MLGFARNPSDYELDTFFSRFMQLVRQPQNGLFYIGQWEFNSFLIKFGYSLQCVEQSEEFNDDVTIASHVAGSPDSQRISTATRQMAAGTMDS